MYGSTRFARMKAATKTSPDYNGENQGGDDEPLLPPSGHISTLDLSTLEYLETGVLNVQGFASWRPRFPRSMLE